MQSTRLPPELRERVHRVAALKGLTFSQVYRLALAEYCARELVPLGAGRNDDIIGEVMDEKHRPDR